jgi:hypothetical protein
VADLHEADLLLVGAKGLHNAVDSISWEPKYHFHTPVDQAFNQNISSRHKRILPGQQIFLVSHSKDAIPVTRGIRGLCDSRPDVLRTGANALDVTNIVTR